MQPTRRGQALRPIVAVVLLLVGVACFGLWRVLAGSEQLPYRSDAGPQSGVRVTRDATYTLAVPGGVQAMLARGVPTAGTQDNPTISLQCTFTSGGQVNQSLATSAESTATKATNTIGSFVAPTSGTIVVACQGWGAVFVTDSDDRAFDGSGLALLIGSIAFAVGACLAVGVGYSVWAARRPLAETPTTVVVEPT